MQGFGRTEPDTVRTSFKRRFACYLALHNFPILFCFGLIMFFWYRRAWVGLTGLCPREARATSQGPQATPPGPGWWWGPLNPRLTLILFLTYTGLSTFAHVHPTQWIMHICMHFLHLPFSAKNKGRARAKLLLPPLGDADSKRLECTRQITTVAKTSGINFSFCTFISYFISSSRTFSS